MTSTEILVNKLVEQYGKERSSLMAVLQGIVIEEKWLSEDAMLAVAKAFDISAADVYGTASFYSFLDTVPRGKNVVRLCKTISCHMQGKDEVLKAVENALKIKVGETTYDKNFSLLTANCLGWCHKGPVMLINNNVYTELTPQKAVEIIEDFAKTLNY